MRVVNNLPAGMSVRLGQRQQPVRLQQRRPDDDLRGRPGERRRERDDHDRRQLRLARSPGRSSKDTAVVDPYDTIDEVSELNNTGSLVSVSGADAVQTGLQITMTDSPDPLRPGDLLTYVITVKNLDTKNRADNVSISDVFQGLDASSIVATTTKGVCTVTAPRGHLHPEEPDTAARAARDDDRDRSRATSPTRPAR